MLRRLLTGVLTVGMLLIATPAYAQPPVTETITEKGVVETFIDVVPTCDFDGPLYTITTTSNQVFHITEFDDGRVHVTGTLTGTFVAEPVDPGLPDFSGKFTTWFGFNGNGKAVNGTFTFTAHGAGTDGSTFTFHLTDHFNATPTGAEFFFTHCHD